MSVPNHSNPVMAARPCIRLIVLTDITNGDQPNFIGIAAGL